MSIEQAAVELSQRQFSAISEFVYRVSRINLTPGKEGLVRTRLAKRVRQLGLGGFDDYVDLVLGDAAGEEAAVMVDLLTTNKTSFFRENQHFDLIKTDRLLLVEIQQASRRGYQNFHASPELHHLGVYLDAAKDNGRSCLFVFTVRFNTVMHLCCQFAGWCKHQGTDLIGARARTLSESLQQRQCKTSRFAGSCLCRGHDVITAQYCWYGLQLYWCRNGITIIAYCFQERFG